MSDQTATPRKKTNWRRALPYYSMVLPGLVYLIINNYIPMFGVIIPFKKIDFSKGIWASEWVGFRNFEFLFSTNAAWVITRNTILYNVAFFIVGTITAVMLAVLLNEILHQKASKFYQTVILLPFLMSWVVISYIVFSFLSSDTGFLNNTVLPALGIKTVNWYAEKKYWPFILVLINTWKSVGYSMIIYLSSVVSISQDYYEAARIDGAGKLQQITRITLPLLKPTVITLLLLSLGAVFRSDFGLFYQVTNNSGQLYEYTRTIDVYVYQALMLNSDFAMSGAAGIYQSAVGFILIILFNYFVKKYQASSSLF